VYGWRRAADCAPYLTLRLSVSAGKRSRARKGADGRIPAENLGLNNQPRRAIGLRALPTLCASASLR